MFSQVGGLHSGSSQEPRPYCFETATSFKAGEMIDVARVAFPCIGNGTYLHDNLISRFSFID